MLCSLERYKTTNFIYINNRHSRMAAQFRNVILSSKRRLSFYFFLIFFHGGLNFCEKIFLRPLPPLDPIKLYMMLSVMQGMDSHMC